MYTIYKHYVTPQKDVFFKQSLHPSSSINIHFVSFSASVPSNITLLVLKGETEYRRFSLGLITSPVFYIDRETNYKTHDLKLDGDSEDPDVFYFVLETHEANVTISLELDVKFAQYDLGNVPSHICANGPVSHQFTAGELMVITNTAAIYAMITMELTGTFPLLARAPSHVGMYL